MIVTSKICRLRFSQGPGHWRVLRGDRIAKLDSISEMDWLSTLRNPNSPASPARISRLVARQGTMAIAPEAFDVSISVVRPGDVGQECVDNCSSRNGIFAGIDDQECIGIQH